MTCCNRLRPLKLNDLTLAKWQIDEIISPFSQDSWSLTVAASWLHVGGSGRKRLSRHRLSPLRKINCVLFLTARIYAATSSKYLYKKNSETQYMLLQSYAQRRRKYSRKVGGGGMGGGAYGTVKPVFKNYWKVLFLHRKSDKNAPFSKLFAKTPFFKELYPTTLKLLPSVMICNLNWKKNTYIYKDVQRRKLLKNAVE